MRAVILEDGKPCRSEDGLPLQRVVCSHCGLSWTLRPSFLYPQLSMQPDVAESAVLTYLSEPAATYKRVGESIGCSARAVWRWVGWVARFLEAARLLSEAELSTGGGQSVALIPREVPQDHEKAYSPERAEVLLRAFQGVVALIAWTRAQGTPPDDPSPLRFWLIERFLTFREVHYQVGVPQSPPLPVASRGPPRVNRRP